MGTTTPPTGKDVHTVCLMGVGSLAEGAFLVRGIEHRFQIRHTRSDMQSDHSGSTGWQSWLQVTRCLAVSRIQKAIKRVNPR